MNHAGRGIELSEFDQFYDLGETFRAVKKSYGQEHSMQ